MIINILSWKVLLRLSLITLVLLLFLNFYNLYTNKFCFFDFSYYLFPTLTIPHFIYLYVVSFKIKEEEYPDPNMRNLEYALYAILLIYAYKLASVIFILLNKSEFSDHVIPSTLTPVGTIIIGLYSLLLILTGLTFIYRKEKIGDYIFDEF